MHRRHALTLIVGFAAGCSSQSSDSTPTSTATDTEAPAEGTDTSAATATQTETTTPTAAPGATLETVAAELNDVYASMEPAFETLVVSGLDTDQLTRQLESIRTTLSAVETTDSSQEERKQSLMDTRWIFDRLARGFGRVRDIYALHPPIHEAYLASERTDQTTAQIDSFRRLATEAGNSVGTAVSRYDSMDSFDASLELDYEGFEDQIFRVSDTVKDFTPLILGLRASIRARTRYADTVSLYEEGSYVDARIGFADRLSEFTDALDEFKETTAIVGPLEPYADFYRCQAGEARLACVDYRNACREQLDDNPDEAAELVEAANAHYTSCEPVE